MIMLHRVLASFSIDMLRILLALYFVNLIKCQQDYHGDSPQPYQAHKVYHHKPPPPPPKPYQAPKVYQQPSKPHQKSPKPYQAPSHHHHVYHHWEAPQPYEDSSFGGVVTGGSPHAYGDNYLAPMQGPGGGISHRFQKPSSIWRLVQPMTAFWSRMPEPARPVVEPRCEAMYDCLAWPFMECMVRIRNTRRSIVNMVCPTNYAEPERLVNIESSGQV